MPSRNRAAFPDDGVLHSDSEEDEFADGASYDEADSEEDVGVSQWEPDSWDGQSDDDSSEDEEEQFTTLRTGLASVPLSTLAKAQRALRGPNEVSTYQEGESSRIQEVRERLAALQGQKRSKSEERKAEASLKRDSKHAPAAMSSKRQVSRLRQVVELPHKERRDPRFSDLSAGGVNANLHQQSYSFLPDILKAELKDLKTALNAASKAERTCPLSDRDAWTAEREQLEKSLARLRTRLDRSEREGRERDALAKAKKAEMAKRQQGKGAWYMKNSDKRDLLLESRFKSLEASGGKMAVKKVIEKKRKKEAGKEKRSRPSLDHSSKRRRA